MICKLADLRGYVRTEFEGIKFHVGKKCSCHFLWCIWLKMFVVTFMKVYWNMEGFQTPSKNRPCHCLLASNPPALGKWTEWVHAQGKSSSNMPWSGNRLICGGDSSWCCSSFISVIRSYCRWSILGPWKCCVWSQGFKPKKNQTLWHWQTLFNVYPVEVLDWCPQIHRNTFSKPYVWWNKSMLIHSIREENLDLKKVSKDCKKKTEVASLSRIVNQVAKGIKVACEPSVFHVQILLRNMYSLTHTSRTKKDMTWKLATWEPRRRYPSI